MYVPPEPRKYGDSIPTGALLPLYNHQIQRKIVLYHNVFRSKVTPTAANMLKMVRKFKYWDKFKHSNNRYKD